MTDSEDRLKYLEDRIKTQSEYAIAAGSVLFTAGLAYNLHKYGLDGQLSDLALDYNFFVGQILTAGLTFRYAPYLLRRYPSLHNSLRRMLGLDD